MIYFYILWNNPKSDMNNLLKHAPHIWGPPPKKKVPQVHVSYLINKWLPAYCFNQRTTSQVEQTRAVLNSKKKPTRLSIYLLGWSVLWCWWREKKIILTKCANPTISCKHNVFTENRNSMHVYKLRFIKFRIEIAFPNGS